VNSNLCNIFFAMRDLPSTSNCRPVILRRRVVPCTLNHSTRLCRCRALNHSATKATLQFIAANKKAVSTPRLLTGVGQLSKLEGECGAHQTLISSHHHRRPAQTASSLTTQTQRRAASLLKLPPPTLYPLDTALHASAFNIASP
jgi:hypothetical protein